MNRPLLVLFSLTVGLSACKRGTPEKIDLTPTRDIVGGMEMIDYNDEHGAYTCRVPRLWGMQEDNGATFVGPRDPKTSGSSYITIARYPDSAPQWTDAQKYAESFWEIDPKNKQPVLEKRKIGNKTVIFLHQERPFYKPHSNKAEYMLRYDYALIPIQGGFFAIEHRAPSNAYEGTLPVFEAVVKSFQLPLPAAAKLDYETFARFHARLMDKGSSKQLENELPRLSRNLKLAEDASERYWTDCTVFDELAKAEILPEKVMKALGIRREVTGGVAHAPAGVMHTYGYLFSQLQTAYGLKGKRWIESRLAERLGLPADAFSPLAAEGEFASNLTSTLLQLIGAPAKVAHSAKLKPLVKSEGRVEQRVAWKTPDGRTVKVSVFTYLVPLAPLAGFTTSDDYLLIYGVLRDGRHRLTTAFPVARSFADGIKAAKPNTEPVFKPRFNLYVDPEWTVATQENFGWRAD